MDNRSHVLIVQGGKECECLAKNLRELSHVSVADGVEQAVEMLRGGEFDVVFSAWDLSDGNWMDLMTALRKQNIHIPAVIYYHCAGEGEWLRALDAGAFDLLAPPFDSYKLRVVLEHAMAAPALQGSPARTAA